MGFKIDANKTYASLAEEEFRFEVFRENLQRIAKHNSEGHTWIMGVTKFADLTREEFIRTYASGRLPTPSGPTVERRVGLSLADLPDSVDWRDKGVITPVRDQGMRGSCWAFAAASSIASHAQINHQHGQTLKELSPQHLVSCTPNPLHCGGTGGCMGAVPQLAFTYASLFGVVTENEYPSQVAILGERETTKSANLTPERPRCLPQRWGSTLCHITTSLRLWTTWQTADPSPHQWRPQTGVSTMVGFLTDVPTTRI